MSKRFGRNQRRRARERIAQVEQALVATLESANRHIAEKHAIAERLRQAEHFQREVAEIVGREAIIAGVPVNMNLDREKFRTADGWQVIPRIPARSTLASFSSGAVPIETMRHETLRLLDIELVADRMRGQMQAWVRIAGTEVCYGITEAALQGLTQPELMRLLVAPIAQQLAMELKGRFR